VNDDASASRVKGMVYLVGAGLGDAAYLTVRGRQVLERAQVLIYDALVDEGVLGLTPPDCDRLYVGKRGGQPSWSQVEIDRLLVEQCLRGKAVVRLKGGDPFVFGRCSSEIEALNAAGCPFEVVPGISSVLAAPELAGIPLTDPVLSSCFAVLSGHDPESLNWEAIAQLPTLVILMGTRQLGQILWQLQRWGKSSQTPIAIVRAAGTEAQRVWTGRLANILDRTRGEMLSPAVVVVGDVVKLREQLYAKECEVLSQGLNPQIRAPLAGKTVLVTRSASQSSTFTDLLTREGARAIEMPALEITAPSSWDGLDRAIAQLHEFDWLILTSANGVDYFCDRLVRLGKDCRALAHLKIAVVGKKTAKVLQGRSLVADFIPPDYVADSLVETFPDDLEGLKILFPRVESGGREVLVAEFTDRGAQVEEVAAYQSGCPATISPPAWDALQRGEVDIVTFASSKTVKYFAQLLERESRTHPGVRAAESWQSLLNGVCIASIGPQTSQTCRDAFGRVDIEAEEYTLEGLVAALVGFSKRR
jgi:uroporphyrinogen III methyltransferase/synthase